MAVTDAVNCVTGCGGPEHFLTMDSGTYGFHLWLESPTGSRTLDAVLINFSGFRLTEVSIL